MAENTIPSDHNNQHENEDSLIKSEAQSPIGEKPEENFGLDNTPELNEAIRSLPPQIRRSFMSIVQGRVSQDGHPLFEKFTSQHIDKWLDYLQKDDDYEYGLLSSNRFFVLAYVLIAVSVLFGLIYLLLPADKGMLQDILKILVVFAGGLGSGFGLKSYLDKKK